MKSGTASPFITIYYNKKISGELCEFWKMQGLYEPIPHIKCAGLCTQLENRDILLTRRQGGGVTAFHDTFFFPAEVPERYISVII